MTRREAIKAMKSLQDNLGVDRSDENLAIDLAIEALQEPKIMRCKGCDYFLGADEDPFCGLCSREDTQDGEE